LLNTIRILHRTTLRSGPMTELNAMSAVTYAAEKPLSSEWTATAPPVDIAEVTVPTFTTRDLLLSPHLQGAIAHAFRDQIQERAQRSWRLAACLLLLGYAPLIGAVVWLATQSPVRLHVLEKDRLGQVVYVGTPRSGALEDAEVTVNQLSDWIVAARSVVRDRPAQDKHTRKVWAMIADESLAKKKVGEFYEKNRLFGNPRRSIDVIDTHVEPVPESDHTWTIEWSEVLYEDVRSTPVRSRHSARVTFVRVPATRRRESDIELNPANIYLTDIVISNR
jgi:type IV secretory pathway TrbF-like protein